MWFNTNVAVLWLLVNVVAFGFWLMLHHCHCGFCLMLHHCGFIVNVAVYGFIANVGVFGFLVNVAVVVLPALLAPPTLRLPLLEIQNTR